MINYIFQINHYTKFLQFHVIGNALMKSSSSKIMRVCYTTSDFTIFGRTRKKYNYHERNVVIYVVLALKQCSYVAL